MDAKYYKIFNQTSDIITNDNKRYALRFLSAEDTISLGTSSINSNIITGSLSDGTQIFNLIQAKSNTASFRSIESMLRADKSDLSSTWYPISMSGVSLNPAQAATFISFDRSLFGDKLSIWSQSHPDFETLGFSFSGSSGYYHVYNYYDFDSAPTKDISSIFSSVDSNFGLVIVTSSATRPEFSTVNWTNSYAGLFFGELGLIMLYNGTTNSPVVGSTVSKSNFIYQQSLHSKTYFCRVTNDVFNGSTNRSWYTYSADLSAYIIRPGINYTAITTIGLYNDNDELLAIAKLSTPVKKSNIIDQTFIIQLQYRP